MPAPHRHPPFHPLPNPWLSLASLRADCCPRPPAGAALYDRLKEYLLTEDQLKENGYPFPHPKRPGGAVIFTAEEKLPKDCELSLASASGRAHRAEEKAWSVGTDPEVQATGAGLTPPSTPPVHLSAPTASCRVCCRCGTEYLVSPSGRCVRDEECHYHWGRLRRNRGEVPTRPLPSDRLKPFQFPFCTL